MLAWGGCGLLAGLLRRLLRRRLAFAAFTLLLGFAFGTVMDVWLWLAFYPHTEAALLARLAAGIPFNVAHAAGNLVLALVAGPELRRVLERYERQVADGGRLGVKLLATLAAVATLATPAGYVQAQQRDDGSFGDAPLTAWATLGLVAAGKDTGRAAEYLKQQEPGDGDRPRAPRHGARRRRRPAGRSAPGPAGAPARQARQRDDLDDPGAPPGR